MDSKEGNSDILVQLMYKEPKVTFTDEPPEGEDKDEIQEKSATQQQQYKKIDLDSPDVFKNELIKDHGIEDIVAKLKHKIYEKIISFANKDKNADNTSLEMIIVDFNEWIEPVLTRRVGISMEVFFK